MQLVFQKGKKRIEADKYDLYLVSPQTRMNFKQLADAAAKNKQTDCANPTTSLYSNSNGD